MAEKKALIVEKQGIIALDIQNTLKRMGYKVMGIDASPSEIEKHLQNDKLDLIISDYSMHESATDFTEKVVLKYKVPIIYLTGSSSAHNSKSDLMENCVIIKKPYDSAELEKTINEMINRNLRA